MQTLLGSNVDAQLQSKEFGMVMDSFSDASQRTEFREDAQRRLVDAALGQSMQRQASSWLAEQQRLAHERGGAAAGWRGRVRRDRCHARR